MDRDEKKAVKVKVNDRRRTREQAGATQRDPDVAVDVNEASGPPEVVDPEENEFLEDLKRVQADFENYRKRVMRDQADVASRAAATVVEGLLPVLDSFERAIEHGEGGEGVQLVFKDLKAGLEREGLEEIHAEGAPFDPNVHDAVESRARPGLEAPVVIEVLRRGYTFKDRLLRAAMVVVGHPAEEPSGQPREE